MFLYILLNLIHQINNYDIFILSFFGSPFIKKGFVTFPNWKNGKITMLNFDKTILEIHLEYIEKFGT